MKIKWGFLAAFVTGSISTALILHPPLTSQDWATWVGAFGTIGAILTAIWVPYRISENAARAEVERVKTERRFLVLSLVSECVTLSAGFKEQTGDHIEQIGPAIFLQNLYLPPDAPFSVYDGCVGRIGLIEDKSILEHIIATYACMNGLLSFMRFNRELHSQLEKAGEMLTAHQTAANKFNADAARQALLDHALIIKERYKLAQNNVNKLRRMVHAAGYR
jgi:hypothetical protein